MDDYIKLAREARKYEDWQVAEKYYDMVQRREPNNIEAAFYTVYGKAKRSLLTDNVFKRKIIINILKNSISLIPDKYDKTKVKENEYVIAIIVHDLVKLFKMPIYNKNDNKLLDRAETTNLFFYLYDACKDALKKIETFDKQPFIYKALVKISNEAYREGIINKAQLNSVINADYIVNSNEKEKFLSEYFQKHPEKKIEYFDKRNKYQKEIYKYDAIIAKLPEMGRITQLNKLLYELEIKRKSARTTVRQQVFDNEIEKVKENIIQAHILKEKAMEPFQKKIDEAKESIYQLELELVNSCIKN